MKNFLENKGSFDLGIPYRDDRIPTYMSILLNRLVLNPEKFDITIITGNHVSIRMFSLRDFKSNLDGFQRYFPRRGEFIFTKNSKGNLSIDYRFDMGWQFFVFLIFGMLPAFVIISILASDPVPVAPGILFLLFWEFLVYLMCMMTVKVIPRKRFLGILTDIRKRV